MQAHKAWKEGGCLRSGSLNDNRLLYKQCYKLAIREAKQNAGKNFDSKLVDSLIVNDQKSFWKEWNANFNHHVLSRQTVENISNSHDICKGFAEYFRSNFVDSGENKDLKDRLLNMFDNYCIGNTEKVSDCFLTYNEVCGSKAFG